MAVVILFLLNLIVNQGRAYWCYLRKISGFGVHNTDITYRKIVSLMTHEKGLAKTGLGQGGSSEEEENGESHVS